MYTVVDVRDVAVGHCYALFKPNLDGQRIALAGGVMYLSEIMYVLREAYPEKGIRVGELTFEEMKASGNPIVLRNLSFIGKRFEVNNEKSVKLLGMKYRGTKETVLEMAEQLQKLGVV